MSYNRITWLPDVLRKAGIEVVLHEGWQERGLGAYKPFDPKFVVWHHDASAPGDSPGVPAYMIRNFESAAAQVWVDRAGRWHIIASGRAAHAGDVLPGKPDNQNSIGIETDHTTGEPWPPAQINSLRKGTAAIFAHWKVGPEHLEFHKTICAPKGRKVDPDGLDLAAERKAVGAVNLGTKPAAPKPPVNGGKHKALPKVSLARVIRGAQIANWSRVIGREKVRADVAIVRAALQKEGVANYRQWQVKLGFTGNDADGIPGRVSLTALGKKHGFVVID